MVRYNSEFIDLKLSTSNLDIYSIRAAILKYIENNIINFSGSLLDIGCGKMPYRSYILENSKVTKYVGLDIETALIYDEQVKPDYTWDGITMPFADNTFDCAFGTEVLEHCPNPTGVLKEVIRVIKPGSVFFFTVPFLWNLHEVPHDEYRYTPFSLERHLKEAGFVDISINATGGWHASMAQMLGLWIKRSPMHHRVRRVLLRVGPFIIRRLLKADRDYMVEFRECQMITGLSGIAWKKK